MSEIFATINFNGEKIEATAENTAVYRHLGKLALYDHVFVSSGDGYGGYIWNHHEMYESLAMLTVKHEGELHVNLRTVAESDQEAYVRHLTRDITDTVPNDWV